MTKQQIWDHRFMELACMVGGWSKDPSSKVGAVIADSSNRIISLGYNGYARGVTDLYEHRELKLMQTIHAEENAILFATRPLVGATIYVNYHPCARCTAKLIQVGITRVVTAPPSADFYSRWAQDMMVAESMLKQVNVSLEIL